MVLDCSQQRVFDDRAKREGAHGINRIRPERSGTCQTTVTFTFSGNAKFKISFFAASQLVHCEVVVTITPGEEMLQGNLFIHQRAHLEQ